MISPQYQAKSASQVVGAEPHGFIADPSRGDAQRVAAGADRPERATWYHSVSLQYQLPGRIRKSRSMGTDISRTLNTRSTTSDTAPKKVVSIIGSGLDPKDERLLFRLGLVLAAAYTVFLAVWLWMTRVRPHDRRRAVRY
jgi:predicted outer membrane lipoprotein